MKRFSSALLGIAAGWILTDWVEGLGSLVPLVCVLIAWAIEIVAPIVEEDE